MNRLYTPILAAAGACLLAACNDQAPANPPPPTTTEEAAPITPESAPVEQACSVMESRDWEAWVNRMPGPDAQATVHVVGKVDVNTSGYTFEWKEGPLDRSATPTLRLQLIVTPPQDMAMQVISTEEVHFSAPAQAAKYGGVLITCGETTLAEIDNVPDAF